MGAAIGKSEKIHTCHQYRIVVGHSRELGFGHGQSSRFGIGITKAAISFTLLFSLAVETYDLTVDESTADSSA